MSGGVFLVPLTNSQRMALVDILIEHLLSPGGSSEFIDVVANKTTSHHELLLLLDRAAWFPVDDFDAQLDSASKLINSLEKTPANGKS
jgi:hypothetical protein